MWLKHLVLQCVLQLGGREVKLLSQFHKRAVFQAILVLEKQTMHLPKLVVGAGELLPALVSQ